MNDLRPTTDSYTDTRCDARNQYNIRTHAEVNCLFVSVTEIEKSIFYPNFLNLKEIYLVRTHTQYSISFLIKTVRTEFYINFNIHTNTSQR